MISKKTNFGTKAVHAGVSPDPVSGAVMTPIYQTSTYAQEAPGKHLGYEYGRTHNPTRQALENSLSALENAKYSTTFASGLAATDAVMKYFKPGDHILAFNDLYGGTYRLFKTVFEKYGIEFSFEDFSNAENIEEYLKPNTKMVWLETPTNPLLKIIDIESVASCLKEKEILTIVDNTFASPFNQTPLDLGADVVVHSITKYIAGHSDVIMGSISTNNDVFAEHCTYIQNSTGAVPSPHDCFLVLRGIKTLHIRGERQAYNAQKLAENLKNHPKVEKVFYPGLEEHEGHNIAKKQMRTSGGMLSIVLKEFDFEQTTKVLSKTRVFTLAESLGGVESLIGHPASMTHASIPKEEREKNGVLDNLIRLSVGIEDIEDIIADVNMALD